MNDGYRIRAEMYERNAFTQHPADQRESLVQRRLDGEELITEESVLHDIQTIKDAGANSIESVFGFFPFSFSNSRFIDQEKTLKEFPLIDQIEAYHKMRKEQDKDEKYQKILPVITKYLKFCHFRDGSEESLAAYKDIEQSIPSGLQNKIIIGLDGRLNLNAMVIKFSRDTTKNIIEKIIRQQSPYHEQICRDSLDIFFKETDLQ